MGTQCCHGHRELSPAQRPARYRRVLWLALAINLAMFLTEILAGVRSGSVALLADALDFLGDAANYGISLWVLALGLAIRARATLLKAVSMAAFGLWVLGSACWRLAAGEVPDAPTMGLIGALALLANLTVAALLYAWRDGDSNMRGVWLCTRNDAIGNIAVMLAALGVFGSGSAWPDLAVGTLMAVLALSAAWQLIRQARLELATA